MTNSILDPNLPRKNSTFKQRAQAAANFHAGMALRFRKLGNEADAKRADQFAAEWQAKADAA